MVKDADARKLRRSGAVGLEKLEAVKEIQTTRPEDVVRVSSAAYPGRASPMTAGAYPATDLGPAWALGPPARAVSGYPAVRVDLGWYQKQRIEPHPASQPLAADVAYDAWDPGPAAVADATPDNIRAAQCGDLSALSPLLAPRDGEALGEALCARDSAGLCLF